jgi:hypothetical protein
MKVAASAALLLVGAGLVACGATNQRAAAENVVRSRAADLGDKHVVIQGVVISTSDPKYATAEEAYSPPNGSMRVWLLVRNGSRWQAGMTSNFFPPACSVAPARVRRELFGTAVCSPPRIFGYARIPWARGRSVRLRYCQTMDGPGSFHAASRGVTCSTAEKVSQALQSLPCNAKSRCLIGSWRCVEYYDGRARGGSFNAYHHALCTNGRRRIEWDGG